MNNQHKYLFVAATQVIFRVLVFAVFLGTSSVVLAQSKSPKKPKAETQGELLRRYTEKERQRTSGGTLKRKKSSLQRAYYKKKSKESGYPGNIWVDPKPKDFTAIKERVERNPGAKNLKAQKSRQSFFQASSDQRQRSFGGDGVVRKNPKLSYRYSSRTMQRSKGGSTLKIAGSNYKKSSRQQQRHEGNIFLKPEALRRDYNEIKTRVERNPGSSMARQIKNQKGTAIANSALTQSYTGDVSIKGRNQASKSSKYHSRVMHQSGGTVKSPSRNMARDNSSSAANFNGNVVLPSRNYKRLRYSYASKTAQNDRGELMRSGKGTGPEMTASYGGNLKSRSKANLNKADKYVSRSQSNFKGDYKRQGKGIGPEFSAQFKGDQRSRDQLSQKLGKKYLSKSQANFKGDYKRQGKGIGPEFSTQFKGDLRSGDQLSQKMGKKYISKSQSNFKGELPARKYGAPSGAQEGTVFAGNVRFYSKRRQDQGDKFNSKTVSGYAGDIRSKGTGRNTPKVNVGGYEGSIAVLSKKQQDKFMNRDSKITGNYSGNIKTLNEKHRAQQVQAKALEYSEYSGSIRLKRKDVSGTRAPGMNEEMKNYQGDIVVVGARRKKLQYEYLSKSQHKFSGEINAKDYSAWSDDRKLNSNMMANFQGNIKLTKAEMNKAQEEHMSKVAHNFEGNIKLTRAQVDKRHEEHMSKVAHNFEGNMKLPRTAKDKYFKNLAERNQKFVGGFTARTKMAKDMDEKAISARVHNYEGGAKTSWLNRLWLNLTDRGDKLEKADNRTRKPKYDSREYKIWY